MLLPSFLHLLHRLLKIKSFSFTAMDSLKLCIFYLLFSAGLFTSPARVRGGPPVCRFPAVYNFGDSNSDTGAISASLQEVQPPNGETFFGHPFGRYCDGRLVIDFVAEGLSLPYLSPYLDSLGTNFSHGANFATGGSTILPGGYSPFHLARQVSQFTLFKSRTAKIYNQIKSNGSSEFLKSILPRPRDFPKALYMFDIGQNDLTYGFNYTTENQTRTSIPSILSEFSLAIHLLYNEGVRIFWVHNTGPVGCLPYSVIFHKATSPLDHNGCIKYQNEVAQEFNKQLKRIISSLRTQLKHASFTYVDVYSAKYALISNAKNLGFVDPFEFCCGSYYGYHIDCGKRAVVNGTVYGNACKDPSKHISWDGIHYTEAANVLVAKAILGASLSSPPIPIQEACQAHQYGKA